MINLYSALNNLVETPQVSENHFHTRASAGGAPHPSPPSFLKRQLYEKRLYATSSISTQDATVCFLILAVTVDDKSANVGEKERYLKRRVLPFVRRGEFNDYRNSLRTDERTLQGSFLCKQYRFGS